MDPGEQMIRFLDCQNCIMMLANGLGEFGEMPWVLAIQW